MIDLYGLIKRPKDSPSGAKAPFILVPGFGANSLTMEPIARRLIQAGHPVYHARLNGQLGKIEKNMRRLEDLILQNNIQNGYIFAHSMGGIISASLGHAGKNRIRKIFTLSTPFFGTYFGLFVLLAPAARQTLPISHFLRARREMFLMEKKIQYIYADLDPIVCPTEKMRLGRKDDIHSPYPGHLRTAISDKGVDFLMKVIEKTIRKGKP